MIQGAHTAKLATVTSDGRPVTAPVWYMLDGEQVIFMTGQECHKVRNISRNLRVSICVDEEALPFAFVILQGTVEIEFLSPSTLLPWSTRIAARDVPKGESEQYGRRNAVEGEALPDFSLDNVDLATVLADARISL